MSQKVKLETEALCVFAGRKQILGPIDLSLEAGRFTSLIGPQSAGKTTLLRALNRLMDERSGARVTGKVLLDGKDIYAKPDRISLTQRVGMVFPEPAVFSGTIWDNVSYGLRLRGVRDKGLLRLKIEEALQEAHLWQEVKDILHHPARELSADRQQRLCFARVFALSPEVLLLDEPFSGIDIGSRSRLEELLHSLRGRYTVLAALGELDTAGRLSDDAAFLLDGIVIEHGPAEEIFTRPKDSRTSDYITGRYVAG